MFCVKCGKEIVNGEICPICDVVPKAIASDAEIKKIDSVVEIEQELSSLNTEEILLKQKSKNVNDQKKEIMKALKKANKQFKHSKTYKSKMNCLTVLLIFAIIICGIGVAEYTAKIANEDYNTEIKELNQKLGQEFANYERQFISLLEQDRKAKVTSTIVSNSNKADSNNYIHSLYRQPTNKIEIYTYNNKEYYKVTDTIAFDKYNLSDSSNNTIFPGAIIKGASLFTNNYTIISTERTPISLISNQENGTPVQVTNPNYSNVTTALNDYANQYSGNYAKEWEYNLLSVSNSQELNATLGIGIPPLDFSIGAKSNRTKSVVTIVYSQIYYSVSMEPMQNSNDYFANGVDLQILGENEPAYISSVDYGRKIYLFISGDMSQQELSAKVSANIKGVDISAGIENIKKDETLQCQFKCYGGKDISSILNTKEKDIGVVGNLKTWLWGNDENNSGLAERLNDILSDSSALINPVPISYSLKYLSDNSIVPPMYINKQSIMLADNAQFISLSLSGMKNNNFVIDTTTIPALLLNQDNVNQSDGKAESSYFEFLWNSAYGVPLILTYGGKEHLINISEYDVDKKILIPIQNISIWGTNHSGNIEIYKTNPVNAIK